MTTIDRVILDKGEGTMTEARPPANARFQPVKSADRTLDILELLATANQRVTLADLSRELNIPKSSLHGLLRTLTRRQWVDVDETGTRFAVGLRALLVGTSFMEADDVVGQSAPVLDWLSAQGSGEVVHLARLDGTDVIYLAKRESKHAIRMYSAIGRRLPVHATALGKVLLSQYTDDEVVQMLKWPLQKLTDSTITDREMLLAELAIIRKNGYAVDNEENASGIRCFAVALESNSRAQDAISFSVPIFRLTEGLESRLVALLREAQQRISLASVPASLAAQKRVPRAGKGAP